MGEHASARTAFGSTSARFAEAVRAADEQHRVTQRAIKAGDLPAAVAPKRWATRSMRGCARSRISVAITQRVYAHLHPDAFAEDDSHVSFAMPDKSVRLSQ
jgi:hypothetical protein